MKTGYFSKHGSLPNAVAISRSVPKGWPGKRYLKLAPQWDWLKLPEEQYLEKYSKLLDGLNAQEVYNDLVELGGEDVVLLCWEGPTKFCHRHLVAEWLNENLNIEVVEVDN